MNGHCRSLRPREAAARREPLGDGSGSCCRRTDTTRRMSPTWICSGRPTRSCWRPPRRKTGSSSPRTRTSARCWRRPKRRVPACCSYAGVGAAPTSVPNRSSRRWPPPGCPCRPAPSSSPSTADCGSVSSLSGAMHDGRTACTTRREGRRGRPGAVAPETRSRTAAWSEHGRAWTGMRSTDSTSGGSSRTRSRERAPSSLAKEGEQRGPGEGCSSATSPEWTLHEPRATCRIPRARVEGRARGAAGVPLVRIPRNTTDWVTAARTDRRRRRGVRRPPRRRRDARRPPPTYQESWCCAASRSCGGSRGCASATCSVRRASSPGSTAFRQPWPLNTPALRAAALLAAPAAREEEAAHRAMVRRQRRHLFDGTADAARRADVGRAVRATC